MSDDPVAIWREAIKDDQHPRHRAAWLLFSENMNPKGAAKLLSANRDDVLTWLYEILDTPALYEEGSLGDGFAPANACGLLGQWQVLDAVPRLWRIVTDPEQDVLTHQAVIGALISFGPPILDFMLERAAEADALHHPTIAIILARTGRGDPRAFEFVRQVFDRQTNPERIELAAEMLFICSPYEAADYIEQQLHRPKYRDYDEMLLDMIDDARNGDYDVLEFPI